MDDVFKYPVFFECPSLQPETIKKIEKYFKIRRLSRGEDCGPVKKVDGDNQTTIYSIAFTDQKDQQAVLQKSEHHVDGLVFTVRDSPGSHILSRVPTSPESQDLISVQPPPALRPPPPDENYEQMCDACIFQYLKDCPKAEQELENLLESFSCYAELHLEDGRLLVRRSASHGVEDEARDWKVELDQFFDGYRSSCQMDRQRMKALFESCQTPDEVHVYRGVDRAVVVGKRSQVEARLKKVEERLRSNEKPTSHHHDLEPSHQGHHQLLDLGGTEKSQDLSEGSGEAASSSLCTDPHGSFHGSLRDDPHGGLHGGLRDTPHSGLRDDPHGSFHGSPYGGLRDDPRDDPHGSRHGSLRDDPHGGLHGGLRDAPHGGLRDDPHGSRHGGQTTEPRSFSPVNSRIDHDTTYPENPNHRKALHGAGLGDGREFSSDRDFHRNGARGATTPEDHVPVRIVQETLESQKVDALVSPMVDYNPCSTRVGITLSRIIEPQLKTSLAKKTSKAATPGDVATVDGFSRSKFKAVFFLNLIPWDGKDGSAAQVMRLGISKILDICERRGFTSVAFPVLGAGVVLKFPSSIVARILLEEVEKFKQGRGRGTSLRVIVAIHPKDKESSEKFKSELRAFQAQRHGTSV